MSFWNSLNTGDTGSGGPLGSAWYESRLYGTLDLRLSAGVSVGTSYTAYTSPSDLFTTAKELGVRMGLDDRARLGRVAINPTRWWRSSSARNQASGNWMAGEKPGRISSSG